MRGRNKVLIINHKSFPSFFCALHLINIANKKSFQKLFRYQSRQIESAICSIKHHENSEKLSSTFESVRKITIFETK